VTFKLNFTRLTVRRLSEIAHPEPAVATAGQISPKIADEALDFFQRGKAELFNQVRVPVKAEKPPNRPLHFIVDREQFWAAALRGIGTITLKLLDISWEVSHGDIFHNDRRDSSVWHLLWVIHYWATQEDLR
jgi:hypothetical protein